MINTSVFTSLVYRLRNALGLWFVAIVIAATFFFISNDYTQNAQQNYDALALETVSKEMAANVVLNEMSRIADSQIDVNNPNAYQDQYAALQQQGVIGTEQRLLWVEHFMAMSSNAAPFVVKVEPRRVLKGLPSGSQPLPIWQFYASKLSFQGILLHEGDVLNLLAQLRQVHEATLLRYCTLKIAAYSATKNAVSDPEQETAFATGLALVCEGDIITIDRSPAGTLAKADAL